MSDWIKIHRSIMDSFCFANPNSLKVWVWMLLKAQFKRCYGTVTIGKSESTVLLERGQFLFGRFKAEEELKLDGSLIYRQIKNFEELEQIIIYSTPNYSIITICNYDVYQSKGGNNEQPPNNHRTTSEQPPNNHRTTSEQPPNNHRTTSEHIEEGKESKEGIESKEYSEQVGKSFEFEKLLNPPSFPNWREEVSNFLGDEYFIQQQVKDKKMKYADVVAHMKQFVYDKNLEGDFKNLKALKKHYGYWYIKHHENRNNQYNQSKAFIEVPTDLDYSKMEVW